VADVWQTAWQALQPPPDLRVQEWAEQFRKLTSAEAEPGSWRNERTPYLVQIMERLSDSDPCKTVVFMKGSQIGGTEVGLNWLGYLIDLNPGRILAAQPGLREAREFSTQRLKRLIKSTPALRGKIVDGRKKDGTNNVLMKEFPGGSLAIVGTNAAAALRSKPIKLFFADEIDNYGEDADNEGDPVALAKVRLRNFGDSKTFIVSTPNLRVRYDEGTRVSGSRVEAAFLEGDRRLYHVPCPECGTFQVLAWDRIFIPEKGDDGQRDLSEVAYICEGCGTHLLNESKEWMLPRGEWRPGSSADVSRVLGWDPPPMERDPDQRSFHLSALYSPVGWHSWAKAVREFLKSKKDAKLLKTWANTTLGQSWDDSGTQAIPAHHLQERAEVWDLVPSGVGLITAGADVQGNRIEVEIVGWGRKWESWSLSYTVIPGDILQDEPWEDLEAILARTWKTEDGRELKVSAAGVDCGYLQSRVLEFTHPRWGKRIWAVKGKEGDRPIWPTRWTRSKAKGAPGQLMILGADEAKWQIYQRLRVPEPGPGFCHFPKDRPPWWYDQLTVETYRMSMKRGRRIIEWENPNNARNEALDCRVYATAAALGLEALGKTPERLLRRMEVDAERPPGESVARAKAKKKGRKKGRADNGWKDLWG
jgi:phage terminase large subunit GpA-like protein